MQTKIVLTALLLAIACASCQKGANETSATTPNQPEPTGSVVDVLYKTVANILDTATVTETFHYDSTGKFIMLDNERRDKNNLFIRSRTELQYDTRNRVIKAVGKAVNPDNTTDDRNVLIISYDSMRRTIKSALYSIPENKQIKERVFLFDHAGKLIADTLYEPHTRKVIWYMNHHWNSLNNIDSIELTVLSLPNHARQTKWKFLYDDHPNPYASPQLNLNLFIVNDGNPYHITANNRSFSESSRGPFPYSAKFIYNNQGWLVKEFIYDNTPPVLVTTREFFYKKIQVRN